MVITYAWVLILRMQVWFHSQIAINYNSPYQQAKKQQHTSDYFINADKIFDKLPSIPDKTSQLTRKRIELSQLGKDHL